MRPSAFVYFWWIGRVGDTDIVSFYDRLRHGDSPSRAVLNARRDSASREQETTLWDSVGNLAQGLMISCIECETRLRLTEPPMYLCKTALPSRGSCPRHNGTRKHGDGWPPSDSKKPPPTRACFTGAAVVWRPRRRLHWQTQATSYTITALSMPCLERHATHGSVSLSAPPFLPFTASVVRLVPRRRPS